MAAWIHAEIGSDLFSIQVNEPYSSDYDECLDRAADEKAKKARPKLKNKVENFAEYDIIFIGYPNWWYTAPMAVFSFLEEYDLSGKKVVLFCFHGTGGLASSVKDISAALPDSTVESNVKAVSVSAYCEDDPWEKYYLRMEDVDNKIISAFGSFNGVLPPYLPVWTCEIQTICGQCLEC